jgi:hypothetical protein
MDGEVCAESNTVQAELASMRALLEVIAAAVVPVGPRNEDGSY